MMRREKAAVHAEARQQGIVSVDKSEADVANLAVIVGRDHAVLDPWTFVLLAAQQ
jgi:hypothetical protein